MWFQVINKLMETDAVISKYSRKKFSLQYEILHRVTPVVENNSSSEESEEYSDDELDAVTTHIAVHVELFHKDEGEGTVVDFVKKDGNAFSYLEHWH